jgi:hypothetical protein
MALWNPRSKIKGLPMMFDLSEFQTPCSPNLKLFQDPQQPEGHHCGIKMVDDLRKEKRKK